MIRQKLSGKTSNLVRLLAIALLVAPPHFVISLDTFGLTVVFIIAWCILPCRTVLDTVLGRFKVLSIATSTQCTFSQKGKSWCLFFFRASTWYSPEGTCIS